MAMPAIRFDDEIRPTRSRDINASGVDIDHGVVFSRNLSTGRRSSRARSINSQAKKLYDEENDEEEDSGLRREGDYKTKQVFSKKQLFMLAYQSTGVIYGDIGTSPLYVYS